MPEIVEIKLQAPEMMNEYFHIEKEGKLFQKWEKSFYDGMPIEFFDEEDEEWIKGEIASRAIDDGSGNAPGANADFFVRWKDQQGRRWRMSLRQDLLIRAEVPTDAELIEGSKWCQGGDSEEQGPYNPPKWTPCHKEGREYIAPSGDHVWYCDTHRPHYLTKDMEVKP